jgi:hypothetical protein
MMREVRNIEVHMRTVILEIYKRFLVDSADQEELQYATLDQEIEVNLIHRNYLSRKDLEICLSFNVESLLARISVQSKDCTRAFAERTSTQKPRSPDSSKSLLTDAGVRPIA